MLMATSASAQSVNLQALGRPIDDDSKSVYERGVYFDDNTTDKNVTLDKAVLSNGEIQSWLQQRIAELLTLNGASYEKIVVGNKKLFTQHGFADYVGSLERVQLPKVLKEQGYKTSAVAFDPPNITAQGLRDETDPTQPDAPKKFVYVWQASVPVTLTYTRATDNKPYKVRVTVEIVRIPMQPDTSLIALNSWTLAPEPEKTAEPAAQTT